MKNTDRPEWVEDLLDLSKLENELSGLWTRKNQLTTEIDLREKRRKEIIERYGRSGRIFKIGDIVYQANKSNEYAGLTRTAIEDGGTDEKH
jgi:hypothetical protein